MPEGPQAPESDLTEKRPVEKTVDNGYGWKKLSQQSIDSIQEMSGKVVDTERVIKYPASKVKIAFAHQQMVTGLTAADVFLTRDEKDSKYSGVSNATFSTDDDGAVLVFTCPSGSKPDEYRSKTDQLIKDANTLLTTLGATELLPEIPSQ